MSLEVTSPAFGFGEWIPDKHTRKDADVSPELRWSGVPEGTAELVVICHDPDAPMPDGFTHWVVYGISPSVTGLPEGGGGAYTQGTTDFDETRYGGPMPPEGHGPHHYYFWVYALGRSVDAGQGLTRRQLLDAIADHIIEQNRLVGVYER